MKAIVTGGAGFIGSHLVDLLLSHSFEVQVVDDLSHGKLKNLSLLGSDPALSFVNADIRDFDFQRCFEVFRPDFVFNLAAQIDVRSSVLDPLEDLGKNVVPVIRIAEAARSTGVRRIVHTSSGGAIYGMVDSFPVSETALINPMSPYAVSKFCGEQYLNMYSNLYGVECAHIAPSNVYGPRQDAHGEAGVVSIFSEAMLSDSETFLFGDGFNTRDYVFVGDVARAFLLAATTPAVDKCRFNIGTGIETPDKKLHSILSAVTGYKKEPTYRPRRLGDIRRSVLDSSKAKALLNWSPEVSLYEGLVSTSEWYASELKSKES